MKIRQKHPQLRNEIEALSKRSDAPFWKAIARSLNRPRRVRYEVSLSGLERHAKAREKIAVPGVVLGTGEITKPLNVYALRFSRSAREKIEKAGGKCFDLEELAREKPSGVRIMG